MAVSKANRKKREQSGPSAFNNVRNQIAYCGLWCGSCSVGNGTANDRAQACLKTIKDYGIDEGGPKGVDYNELLRGLTAISSMKPCVGCLKGGGKTNCEIRACAKAKHVAECAECGNEKTCIHADFIQHMRSGALRVGMKVKTTRGSSPKQLNAWRTEFEEA